MEAYYGPILMMARKKSGIGLPLSGLVQHAFRADFIQIVMNFLNLAAPHKCWPLGGTCIADLLSWQLKADVAYQKDMW